MNAEGLGPTAAHEDAAETLHRTLQHAATHTEPHTVPYYNTLPHSGTQWNTLQHTATAHTYTQKKDRCIDTHQHAYNLLLLLLMQVTKQIYIHMFMYQKHTCIHIFM